MQVQGFLEEEQILISIFIISNSEIRKNDWEYDERYKNLINRLINFPVHSIKECEDIIESRVEDCFGRGRIFNPKSYFRLH